MRSGLTVIPEPDEINASGKARVCEGHTVTPFSHVFIDQACNLPSVSIINVQVGFSLFFKIKSNRCKILTWIGIGGCQRKIFIQVIVQLFNGCRYISMRSGESRINAMYE